MKKTVALLLTLAMLLSVALASAETFRQGIDPEYPPFSYRDESGQFAGFDVDVCKAVCEKLGWEYEAFPVNWDTKEQSLSAGEHDCVWSGMTIKQSMIDAGFVISAPYYENKQVILTKDGNGIASSADLAGKRVAVMLATSGEDMLAKPQAEGGQLELAQTFEGGAPVTMESFLNCATELDAGGVDAVIVDLPVAINLQSKYQGFIVLDEVLGEEQYGILFRSGDEELCKQVEGAVAELVADGTYAELLAKYTDLDPLNFILLNAAE